MSLKNNIHDAMLDDLYKSVVKAKNNKGLTDAGKKDIFNRAIKSACILLYYLEIGDSKSWLNAKDIPTVGDTIKKYNLQISQKDLSWFDFETYDNVKALKIINEFDRVIQAGLDTREKEKKNSGSEI